MSTEKLGSAWENDLEDLERHKYEIFDALVSLGDWAQYDRLMYGNVVEQPRLNSSWHGPEATRSCPFWTKPSDTIAEHEPLEIETADASAPAAGVEKDARHVFFPPSVRLLAGVHGLSTAWHLATELERRGEGDGGVFEVGL